MKALITGGRGYIGGNLAEMLEDPLILDSTDGWDVTVYKDVFKLMIRSDVCYHLAAISGIKDCEVDPLKAIETNIIGTMNVAKAAKYCGVPMVFASSFAVNNPSNVYAMTKYLGEKIVLDLGGNVVRIANVYGGLNYTEKKGSAVAALMKGTWEERGLGMQTRDFVHVKDVCETFIVAALDGTSGSITEASSGVMMYIDELITLSKMDDFPDNIKPYQSIKLSEVKLIE